LPDHSSNFDPCAQAADGDTPAATEGEQATYQAVAKALAANSIVHNKRSASEQLAYDAAMHSKIRLDEQQTAVEKARRRLEAAQKQVENDQAELSHVKSQSAALQSEAQQKEAAQPPAPSRVQQLQRCATACNTGMHPMHLLTS
jgi:chromosome condensin MukBEF ATPase and DNA-binding subunit MukB